MEEEKNQNLFFSLRIDNAWARHEQQKKKSKLTHLICSLRLSGFGCVCCWRLCSIRPCVRLYAFVPKTITKTTNRNYQSHIKWTHMRNNEIATITEFERARVCKQRHLRCSPVAKCHIVDYSFLTFHDDFDTIRMTERIELMF